MQYLAAKRPESGLLPSDPLQRVLVNQWQCWDLAHWDPACSTLIFENLVKQLFHIDGPDAVKVADGEERFHRVAAVLDGQLKRNRFVVGESPTLADFSIGASLNSTNAARIPVQRYENVVRWYKTLTDLPGWRKSVVSPPNDPL
jgi:glutathione S-transferase